MAGQLSTSQATPRMSTPQGLAQWQRGTGSTELAPCPSPRGSPSRGILYTGSSCFLYIHVFMYTLSSCSMEASSSCPQAIFSQQESGQGEGQHQGQHEGAEAKAGEGEGMLGP